MTAIAGYCEGGKVWIAGDSAGVSNYSLTSRKDSKVFHNGECLFGITTSFRMGQLLRYSLTVPELYLGADPMQFMCTSFINAVRACLKEGGYAKKENEAESGGTFLVGYRSRLFMIDGDYQVAESMHPYEACGCAVDTLRGALGALALSAVILTPQDRLHMAMKTAELHSTAVCGPYIVESI